MSQFLNICILPASIQNFGLVIYVEINLLDKSRVWKLLAKNFLQSETPMIDKRSEQPSPVLLENREWSRVETPAFLWLEDNGVCIFVAATSRASAFVLFTTGDTSLVSVNRALDPREHKVTLEILLSGICPFTTLYLYSYPIISFIWRDDFFIHLIIALFLKGSEH